MAQQNIEQKAEQVSCKECGKSDIPITETFRTRHGDYVCKGQCLHEYLETDANYAL